MGSRDISGMSPNYFMRVILIYSCILIPGNIFNCIFNNQPGLNVQLVIQQYIELLASAQCTAKNYAVYRTTSWLLTASSKFSFKFNYQLGSN